MAIGKLILNAFFVGASPHHSCGVACFAIKNQCEDNAYDRRLRRSRRFISSSRRGEAAKQLRTNEGSDLFAAFDLAR
jgi:hypothetical protein